MSVIIFLLINCVNAWDLINYGIGPNYYVSSIAVFRNRAFLTLPRSSCHNNISNPTLIELPWTGERPTAILRRKLPFPSNTNQNFGNCQQLQNSVSVDLEVKKSRLWVLDAGLERCPPKIVIYNLVPSNEIRRFDLSEDSNLEVLVVDSQNEDGKTRAYVGGNNGFLIVVQFSGEIFKIQLESDDLDVGTSKLALSKKFLYLTDPKSHNLFSANLTDLEKEGLVKNVDLLGQKLGPSGGMVTDLKNGLNYYLTRDYVVLRWDTKKPLQAEYHDVLAQSYQALPNVPQLFTGPQKGIWALINPAGPLDCANQPNLPILRKRVVKLLKYNRKTD